MATYMVRGIVPIICLLLVVMDVVAGILGIEAQLAQNKESYIKVMVFECRQPSYQAYRLGMAAAILLALAHALANALGGCVCLCSSDECRRSSPNRQLTAGSLAFSWIILIVALSLLIIGTISNSRSRDTCGFSSRHMLAIGGILCFIHGLFLVPYYIAATATSAGEDMTLRA